MAREEKIDEDLDLEYDDLDLRGKAIIDTPRVTKALVDKLLDDKSKGKDVAIEDIQLKVLSDKINVPIKVTKEIMKSGEFRDYINERIPTEDAVDLLRNGMYNDPLGRFKYLELYFKLMGRLDQKNTTVIQPGESSKEVDMMKKIINGEIEHVYAGEAEEEEEESND